MKRLALMLPTLVSLACSQPSAEGESVRLTIPRGASVTTVSDSLTARGIIGSARWFRLYTKLVGYERSIQAGVYDLPLQAKSSDVLWTLVAGRTAQDRVVVPEGLMITEIAELVESQLGISEHDFIAAAQDSGLVASVGAKEQTLEGYLYPSTYHVSVGASALDVVRQMVSEFEMRWRPEWDARLDTLKMTREQTITLASIIEGEAQDPADLRYVSSVYHNRLARGMRLEADPTVIYALGTRRRLFERDYRTPSRYNTYLIDGLPPHPIAQPSAATIAAALYPRESDFLFFVAGPDGRHIFSRSYREHIAAIRQVRDR